jgi:hypothetical protein
MRIEIIYSLWRTIIYIILLLLLWCTYTLALVIEISKGVTSGFYFGAGLAFFLFTGLTFVIYNFGIKFTCKKYKLNLKSISFKRQSNYIVLNWNNIIRIYESERVPTYLDGSAKGYIIEYFDNGALKSIHLIKNRKLDMFFYELDKQNIISIQKQ